MDANSATKVSVETLQKKAKWVRHQTFEMIAGAGKGHIGGSLSCADILVTLYHGGILRVSADKLQSNERDRFILSKGHSCESYYCVLADRGFFPKEELSTFCQNNTRLAGHPDRKIPGVEIDSGSLGHGIAIGSGIAFAHQLDGKDPLTIVLIGDAESGEGAIWESAIFAAQHKLNRLCVIVDYNHQAVTDYVEDCADIAPLAEKWRAFNWEVREVDGHSIPDLLSCFSDLRVRTSTQPLVVIAHTVKGKGISFMERDLNWHHGVPKGEELIIARRELALHE